MEIIRNKGNIMNTTNLSFWKKFSHFLLIGLSVLVLFALAATVQPLPKHGPQAVQADSEDYNQLGEANPAGTIGYEPLPNEPAPASNPAPAPSGPYITSSGAQCIGRQSCWVNTWSDGRDDHECYGEIAGQCGVQTQSAPQTQYGNWYCDIPHSCNGGSNYQMARTVTTGGNVSYETKCDTNQCGISQPAAPQQQPQQQAPQCTHTCGANGQRACGGGSDSRQNGCFNDDSRCQDGLFDTNGTCLPRQQQQAQQPAAPAVASVTTGPNNTNNCGPGTSFINGVCLANVGSNNGNNNGSRFDNIGNNNGANVTINNPAPVVYQYPVVRLASAGSECPTGYSRSVDANGVITCTAPAPVVVAAANTEAKKMPATGLPIAFWAAAAFVPAGLRMKKFGKGITPDFSNPNYIWDQRNLG